VRPIATVTVSTVEVMRAGVQSLNYKKSNLRGKGIGCPLTLPSPTNHHLLAYCRMLDSENQ